MTTTTTTLTDHQAEHLHWIRQFIHSHGFSPTVREAQRAFGLRTPNAVMAHWHALRRKKAVTWMDGSPRTIRPVEEA